MNETQDNITPMDPKLVKQNRIKLIAIFGVALLPLILAVSMYFGNWAIPQGKTNKGTLIWPPVTLNSIDSKQVDDQDNDLMKKVLEAKTWTIMMTGGSTCEKSCADTLHTIRQVNVALGKENDRVGRILVSSLPNETIEKWVKEYPRLVTHFATRAEIEHFQREAINNGAKFDSTQDKEWNVWVVDPLGNVILQYSDNNDGYDMIDDLKRLLKLSNIG